MAKAIFEVDILLFEAKALQWAQQYNEVCFLQSNGYADEYTTIQSLLAVDAVHTFIGADNNAFEGLEKFKAEHPNQWMLGFFSYDLKEEIEHLVTPFANKLGFPDAYFFIPRTVIQFWDTYLVIQSDNPQEIFDLIESTIIPDHTDNIPNLKINNRLSKTAYFDAFEKMMYHIRRGDIYEVNLCQEFFAQDVSIQPLAVYHRLNQISPTPFSTFFKVADKYILSASPERFMAKRGSTLLSQPIKGTAARGKNQLEDAQIIENLRNNPKEIAENVMIVDLVRNDMTRSAMPGTVAAERKLEVHTFKQVHQLISTITCTQHPEVSDIQAIKYAFPPGSMTGAPKISAMQLCDRYENSRRGIYAGTVGYFAPNGDFDFNVIIRTLLYNSSSQYLSFHTGGALTIDADAEKEYQECLLKASGILKTLDIN